MSHIAQSLGSALGALFRSAATVNLNTADPQLLDDLRLDASAVQRSRFRGLHMGEPGASNAARLGVNGR